MADSPNSKPDPSKRWSRRYYLLLWILIALFFVGVGVWRYKSLPPAPRWRAMLRNEFVIHIDDKRDRIITAQEGRGVHLRNVMTGEIEDTAFHGRPAQLLSDNQSAMAAGCWLVGNVARLYALAPLPPLAAATSSAGGIISFRHVHGTRIISIYLQAMQSRSRVASCEIFHLEC